MNRSGNKTVKRLIVCAALVLFTGLFWASAQSPLGSKGKNLQFPDYDSQQRLRSLLTADEATPRGAQQYNITGLRVEMYAYENNKKSTSMVVTAQQCTYDQKARVAESTNVVVAQTGDGKLRISGEGFRWRQVDSGIILSNRVRAVIGRELLEKEGK
jgi:hypothetical protein